MSQKHAKRRHSTKKRVTAPAQESEFASDGRRKRMNPAARNLLFISLIILALSEVLVRTNTVTELVATLICIPALIALVAAVYLQFRRPGNGAGEMGRRLK